MTADEAIFAGGLVYREASTWYSKNSDNRSSTGSNYWWLMSPRGLNSVTKVFIVTHSSNYLDSAQASFSYNVRPVLSLKSCVKYASGDGSASNPYTIQETTSGC